MADGLAKKMASGRNGKWMQGAVKNPGYLHRALGVPQNKTIPKAKVAQAANSSNQHLAAAARLAQTFARSR